MSLVSLDNFLTEHGRKTFSITRENSLVDQCVALFGPFYKTRLKGTGMLFAILTDRRTLLCIDAMTASVVWTYVSAHLIRNFSFTDCFVTLETNFVQSRLALCSGIEPLKNQHFLAGENVIRLIETTDAKSRYEITKYDALSRKFVATNYITFANLHRFNIASVRISAKRRYMIALFNEVDVVVKFDLARRRTFSYEAGIMTMIPRRLNDYLNQQFYFSPVHDNLILAVSRTSQAIFDLDAEKQLYLHENGADKLKFSSDGNHLLIQNDENQLSVRALFRQNVLVFQETLPGLQESDVSGRFLFISTSGETKFYDIKSKKLVMRTGLMACNFMPTFEQNYHILHIRSAYHTQLARLCIFEPNIVLFDAIYAFIQAETMPLYHVLQIVEFLPRISNMSLYFSYSRAKRLQDSCRKIRQKRLAFRP